MIACLLPVITAPLTACWWLPDQGLDSSDERAREQTEAFLLNVHLPADGPHGWPTVFARLATSRRLKRLNITMCLIPRTCCKGGMQLCCWDQRCALPCDTGADAEVPFQIGLLGLYFVGKPRKQVHQSVVVVQQAPPSVTVVAGTVDMER